MTPAEAERIVWDIVKREYHREPPIPDDVDPLLVQALLHRLKHRLTVAQYARVLAWVRRSMTPDRPRKRRGVILRRVG